MRLRGAFIASGVKPISNGQASVVFCFLYTHHLALNFGAAPPLARPIIDMLDGSRRAERGGQNETGFLVHRITQEANTDATLTSFRFSSALHFRTLLINILIFDTSVRHFMISHRYPRAVIGILHDSSTILGYSDYNVLGLTRTRQGDLSIDLRPPSPSSPPLASGPVATFPITKRPRQMRYGCEIDIVALEIFFMEEFEASVKREAIDQCRKAKNSVKKAAHPKAALEENYIEAKKGEENVRRYLED
ncbi:MAG: hypothetical protein J3R72DRAFT_17994 [Linnemannia gamsii]|nr:MAG: hypothetical protein J3R72DRAFT_17994 [Linnemannia gamsii]